MKVSKVKVPLYFQTIKIIVAKNLSKAIKKCKIKTNQNPNDYEAFVVQEKNTISVFVKPKVRASIIAHESVHIVNYIFINTGVKLDIYNDEAQAYLTGWVVCEIIKALK